MNEDQNLQELFHQFKAEVSASDKLKGQVGQHLSQPQLFPHRMRLALAGGMVAAVCIVGGVVVLLPSASAAGTYHRVESAINDAKYMHVKSYCATDGKPRRLYGELFYSDGNWRSDAFPNSKLARSFIRKGDDQWLYIARTDVAIQEPFTGGFLDHKQTAIEFAEDMSDEGNISSQRDFSIEARPDENGHPVYAVIATRKDTPYHLEMIVDKATNLPIRTTFSGEPNRILSAEYSFGDSVDPKAFSPQITPTTKVLRMGIEAETMKSNWRTPVKSIQVAGTSCDVRDVTVNDQGDVFVATSFPDRPDPKELSFPKNLLPNGLTDDQGRNYLLVETNHPGGVFGDTRASKYFQFGKDKLVITEWAPVTPLNPWLPAKSLQVKFQLRSWEGYPVSVDPSVQTTVEVPISHRITQPFPSYSSGMLLDDVHREFEEMADDSRAEISKKKHAFGQAAFWYFKAAEEAKPLSSYKEYERKARWCQTQAGAVKAP